MEASKKKKMIAFVVAGITTVGLAYWSYQKWFKKEGEYKGRTLSTNRSRSNTSKPTPIQFPLKEGSKGDAVKGLQQYLNSRTRPPRALLKVDGVFGPKTKAAVQRVLGSSSVSQQQYQKLNINPFKR